jgi:hypothetical protein
MELITSPCNTPSSLQIRLIKNLMPRKGPPKSTRRDDNDNARKESARKRVIDEAKTAKSVAAVEAYDKSSIPKMPDMREDQRALRRGLEARGEKLLRHGDTGVKLYDVIPPSASYSKPGEVRVFSIGDDSS